MKLESILQSIRENFSQRKMIDFDKEDLHFEIEPLTSKEEVIIIESLKDIEESEYIEGMKRNTLACSIKKINDLDLDKDEIENEEGETKSKFLYMVDYLSKFPSSLIDVLFEAFTHMAKEAEQKIKDSAKFERLLLSDEIEDEETKGAFKRVVENTTAGMNEIEKLKEKVDQEIENADIKMSNAEQETPEAV